MASNIKNLERSYYRQLARLPKEFSYLELVKATDNFSKKLGGGGSGSVFEGYLNDETPIAVKKVERSEYGKIFFEAEVSTITSVQHIHLVHLHGFCSREIETGGDSYIVYDLLRNGSLDTWIFPKEDRPSDLVLPWKLRYQVAIEVAKALIYLHDYCRPPIFHFDVKPANILLDDDFHAVLDDFGLSVLTKKDGSHMHSFISRGTRGYIAPEMVKSNLMSFKSDMYSFGKVLLDLFFGELYVCLDISGNDIYKEGGNSFPEVRTFHAFMRKKLKKKEIVHLVDKRLGSKVNEAEINTLVDVALCCVEEDPWRRPRDMQNVLQLLEQGQQDQNPLGDGNKLVVIFHGALLDISDTIQLHEKICAELSVGKETRKTSYVPDLINPKWEGEVIFSLVSSSNIHTLNVRLLNSQDEPLAHAEISLFDLIEKKMLKKRYEFQGDHLEGQICIELQLRKTPGTTNYSEQAVHILGPQLRKPNNEKTSSSGSFLAREETPPPRAYYAPLESVPVKRSEIFASQQSVKQQILKALIDNQVNLVGVHGMGGVGKTTLMNQILQHASGLSLFDKVLMVTISQNLRLINLQTEIAEKLGMILEETSVSVRAARLFARLKLGKVLMILDDMWKKLSLVEVGIPLGEDHHDCKVVITTRSLELCSHMDAQVIIEVKLLAENESWELFQQNASFNIYSSDNQSLAKKVVKECKGLPLAIVVLAKALKGKDRDLWRVAFQQLKKSTFTDISPAFTSIRLSYDYLESRETKLCFLLCCLFPEDFRISMDKLLMYTFAEEILGNTDTLAEARGRVLQMVDKLLSSGLLLKCNGSDFIMHDIVRDVAICIASEKGNDFMVKAGMGLKEWPKLKMMGNILRLSLMSNDISAIDDQLGCQQLSTLSLARNKKLLKISEKFFTGMNALTTLNLSETDISSLPQMLSNLTNLQTLDLGGCQSLVDVSMLGCLRNLEILNLSCCKIRSLPWNLKLLTNLKLLNLSGNYRLKMIPPNVISCWTRLEELYMINSFDNWEIEGIKERKKACWSELLSLTNLSTLFLRTKDVSLLYKDSQWKNLLKFKITVCENFCTGKYPNSFVISIHNLKAVAEWVRASWERTDELCLHGCGGINNVVPLLRSRFNNLKSLYLYECTQMKYLMLSQEIGVQAIFLELEELSLKRMREMKGICCNGPISKGSLMKLKLLQVDFCDELVNVIPSELLVNFNNLESVKVRWCGKVEVLFTSEGILEERHANMLSNLREILLLQLPKLRTIWKGFSSVAILHNLKVVTILCCSNLRYLFPVSMAKSLQQLEKLKVEDCRAMVQIFGTVEDEEIYVISSGNQPPEIGAVFPRLKNLELEKLQCLSRFHSQSLIIFTFPSLEKVTISSCPMLRYLLPVSMANNLQGLEILEIKDCYKIVHIIGSEDKNEKFNEINTCSQPPEILVVFPRLKSLKLRKLRNLSDIHSHNSILFSFPSLQTVTIDSCPKLRYLFPISMAKSLQQLEYIWIENCWILVEIFGALEEIEINEISTCPQPPAVFPRLQILDLLNLRSLSQFHSQSSVIFSFPSLEKVTISSCP